VHEAPPRELLAAGPPFDLDATRFDRHAVYLTDAVFVFEAPGEPHARSSQRRFGLWHAALAWRESVAGRPRIAEKGFTWERAARRPQERSTDHGR
jgi:hypothetical protein